MSIIDPPITGSGGAMKRWLILLLLAYGSSARAEFNVVEASIADMQQAMQNGRATSRELVQQYLARIAFYDRKLNAVITVNPNALREADERDRERAQGTLRGPLHGIPIAVKDNTIPPTCPQPVARLLLMALCRPTRRRS